jgi:hypothetical protein
MRVKGDCFIGSGPEQDAPANDNLHGDADFIAGNVATTELTAMLAASLMIEDGLLS